MTTIAQCSAAALEKALRYAALFVGQDPNEIIVKPNLRFVDTALDPVKAASLVTIWQAGGMSKISLIENLQRGDIVSDERTVDEEIELINQEMIDNPLLQDDGSEAGGGGPLSDRFIESGEGLDVKEGS